MAPSLVKFAATKGDNRHIVDAIDKHLIKLKANPASLYYQAFNKWFETDAKSKLPIWIFWVLAVVGILIAGLSSLTVLFRRSVKHKTSELEKSKAHLERMSYYDSLTWRVCAKEFLPANG